MTQRSDDDAPRPLPPGWLPEPLPPEGAPVWDTKMGRIMAAADPELRRLRDRRTAAGSTAWSVLGLWWKPAAALAAVAAVLSLVTGLRSAFPEARQDWVSLSLIAAEGDPVTLWEAFGIQADPVLALIALQEEED